MKVQLLTIFLIASCFNLSNAGEKRGGGSMKEMLIQQGVAPSFFELFTVKVKSEQEYKDQFCDAGKLGIKFFEKGNFDKSLNLPLIATKLAEVCRKKAGIILRKDLVDENRHILTAMNWPESSVIAINPDAWDDIEDTFIPEIQKLLYQVIAVHEVLSLLGYEQSHKYQWSSLLLKDSTHFSDLPSLNQIEKAIGMQAYLFEMDNSQQEKTLDSQKSGLFAGMITNHLRHQLMSFSPLFDAEIKANIGINYKIEFNTQKRDRGEQYVLGHNNYLLKPIISRIRQMYESLGIKLKFESEKIESWSVAVQLHQLLLVLIDPSSIAKELAGYEVIITDKSRFSFSQTMEVDSENKKIKLKISSGIDRLADSLTDYYSYIIPEMQNRRYLSDDSPPRITFTQNWPELSFTQEGKILITVNSQTFDFFPYNPTYLDTFLVTGSGGGPWAKTSTDLMTTPQIRDFLKQKKIIHSKLK
ncbi:MAG: hypothetical protein AABY64_01500 [Bdellovibrionota bacterium]